MILLLSLEMDVHSLLDQFLSVRPYGTAILACMLKPILLAPIPSHHHSLKEVLTFWL